MFCLNSGSRRKNKKNGISQVGSIYEVCYVMLKHQQRKTCIVYTHCEGWCRPAVSEHLGWAVFGVMGFRDSIPVDYPTFQFLRDKGPGGWIPTGEFKTAVYCALISSRAAVEFRCHCSNAASYVIRSHAQGQHHAGQTPFSRWIWFFHSDHVLQGCITVIEFVSGTFWKGEFRG